MNWGRRATMVPTAASLLLMVACSGSGTSTPPRPSPPAATSSVNPGSVRGGSWVTYHGDRTIHPGRATNVDVADAGRRHLRRAPGDRLPSHRSDGERLGLRARRLDRPGRLADQPGDPAGRGVERVDRVDRKS